MMKTITSTFSVLLLIVPLISAQSFNDGMELYNNGQFLEAAEMFSRVGDQRSQLFAGKSYLALSEYPKANIYLNRARSGSIESVRHEALYTLALSHFEIKNFDLSLNYLYEVIESRNQTGLRNDARRFYSQILDYLTLNQRFELLHRLDNPSIQLDLVLRSRTYLDNEPFRILANEFLKLSDDPEIIRRIESELRILTSRRSTDSFPTAPIGTVFNVGVILPEFNENDPDFTIPRNLYFGMILAADDFNNRNIDQKVRLHFRNSAEDPDVTARAFTELIFSNHVDAVIGPLFSEPASRMARLSEDYRIPMLAPLANSDQLNRDYNYTFQLNPTFETHGKHMARFAVQELRLDTLAIITEPNSPGRSSALAFRHEAERLGAYISYYIEEDFAASGYDFTEVTEVFTPEEVLIDSLGYQRSQAIYAPFTGQASTTMMNLMLNTLESMRSELIILGNEEWEFSDLTPFQQRFFEIYYTRSYTDNLDPSALAFFEEDFESRFGYKPDRFSRLGYDTASYLFESLERAGNPHYLERALRTSPLYDGLAIRIRFDGNRINQYLHIQPHSDRAKNRIGNR